MFQWKRENLEGFPLVYTRFQSRDYPGDTLVEYRIQDLPEDRFEDAVKFLTQDFYLREEQLFRAFGNNSVILSRFLSSSFLLSIRDQGRHRFFTGI